MDPDKYQYVTLISDSTTPCGVEAFARRLSKKLGIHSVTSIFYERHRSARLKRLPQNVSGVLIINLPIVAWKRMLIEPIMRAARSRSGGHYVVVVLHEWNDLDWKRRASYIPLLLLADVVMFSCPLVARTFGQTLVSIVTTGIRGVLPIPPNVSKPAVLRHSPHSERVLRERDQSSIILGHFGSIYPRKRSSFVLDVAAELKARGENPFVVFAGSFIQGQDSVEQDFFTHVQRLGLHDNVLVSGFIAEEEELFGLLSLVDVFAYSFAEGLSTRRASVFACLTAGKPVVVNAPQDIADFDHHPTYRALLESGLLRLVSPDADVIEMANAVQAARDANPEPQPVAVEAAWASVTRTFIDVVSRRSGSGGMRDHAVFSKASRPMPSVCASAPDASDVSAHQLGGWTS